MIFRVDTSDIDQLTKAMARHSGIMPRNKVNSALRRSAKPMLVKAQAEAPVGASGRERISLAKGRATLARRSNPNGFRRGGATKRDLRLKAVPPERNEIGRVLVGVSKRADKVGWRTIFITNGTRRRSTRRGANRGSIKANNFLQRSFDSTISFVRVDFLAQYREAFATWAKTTWPQHYR